MRARSETRVSIRIGSPLTLREHPIARLAKFLLAACIINACASAAELPNTTNQDSPALSLTVQLLIEPCKEALAAPALDSIRSKADLSRRATDGPPPFRIALNDTFATDSERIVIAQWIKIQHHCRRQFALSHAVLRPVNAIEAASLREAAALSRILQSSVGRLTQALYYQQLTYGEFAHKRFEFHRDAAALGSAIDEAGRYSEPTRLAQTLRQLLYLRRTWNAFLWRLNYRQPRTVHIQGALYI
jgi:hypothetical protein